MPFRTDIKTLQDIIRIALAVRNGGECRVDITKDTIRIRARSEDHTAYLDWSLPKSVPEFPGDGVTDTFWVQVEPIRGILNTCSGTEVSIRTPSETSDSTLTLQSAGQTYQQAPRSKYIAHRIPDTISTGSPSEWSLQNDDLDRAVYAANLMGTKLRVQFDRETRQVRFSADGDNDSFTYVPRVEQIHSTHPSNRDLTISIDRLRDITPLIPATYPISLELSQCLVYRAEYPVTGADLTVYVAEYLDTVETE